MVRGAIERYGVYLAELDATRGREMSKTRPAVVVSHEAMNRHLDTVVVCPLTSKLHPAWRSRVQCTCARRPAEIAVDQIRTVSKGRLGKRIDRLSSELALEVRLLISEMYGEP